QNKVRVYRDNYQTVTQYYNNSNHDLAYYMNSGIQQVLFASNEKAQIQAKLNSMTLGGNTRINIGLMWGWFIISPKWQGLWDAGKPNLPAPSSPNLEKAIVLMTDGKNY